MYAAVGPVLAGLSSSYVSYSSLSSGNLQTCSFRLSFLPSGTGIALKHAEKTSSSMHERTANTFLVKTFESFRNSWGGAVGSMLLKMRAEGLLAGMK